MTGDLLLATRRRRSARALSVTGALAAVVVALFVLTLMVGSVWLTPGEVLGSLLRYRDDPSVDFIIRGLRLQTAVAALAVRLALGASGTVVQQLLRPPQAWRFPARSSSPCCATRWPRPTSSASRRVPAWPRSAASCCCRPADW